MTVRYSPPELVSNLMKSTSNTDVYSFGCIIFELFTGKVPYCCERNPNGLNSRIVSKKESILDHYKSLDASKNCPLD